MVAIVRMMMKNTNTHTDPQHTPEITLVANEHDDDVGLRVIAKLLEPPLHVFERDVLGDIVHEQRTHRPSVIRRRDRPVSHVGGRNGRRYGWREEGGEKKNEKDRAPAAAVYVPSVACLGNRE